MNKLHITFAALAAAAMLTACGTDDPAKKHTVDSFTDYFAYNVNDLSAPEQGWTASVGKISVDFDDDHKTAILAIENLSYGTAESFTTINQRMTDLPYYADDHGVRTMAVDNVTGKQVEGVDVERVNLTYYPDREVEGTLYHGLCVTLKIGSCDITLMPKNPIGVGTTETTNVAAQTKFESTKTIYRIGINPSTRAATLQIDKAAFAEGMPALGAMDFLDGETPVVKLRPGGFTIAVDSLIPAIDGVPQPRRGVDDLKVTCESAQNKLQVEFRCMKVFTVDSELSGCYTVQTAPVVK